MDMMGHVNNTLYFRYMEQARIEWIYSLVPEGNPYSGAATGPVIVNASCTFLAPLVYPGDIEVTMFLGEPGRTSVNSFYEILMDGRKYAEGASKLVWIDLTSGRPVPVPESVLAPLRALESAARGGTAASQERSH